MLDRSEADFRPPAPYPVAERLGLFKLLVRLKRNPLECWSADFFQQPIARARLPFTDTYLVHDPAAIKRVLMDHAANYPKDPIQRRILVAGLADGLLSVEGSALGGAAARAGAVVLPPHGLPVHPSDADGRRAVCGQMAKAGSGSPPRRRRRDDVADVE